MQHGFLKVAAMTPAIQVADCAFNADAIIHSAKRAHSDGVRLLVLPELCLTGYTCGDLFLQYALQKNAMDALRTVCEQTANLDTVIVFGMPVSVAGSLYNCGAVLHHGRLLGVVPKTTLPNYGEFYEKRIFSPAPDRVGSIDLLGESVPFGSRLLFQCNTMPELTFGVEICEDLWSPLPPSTRLAACGATVILNLSASDEAVTKASLRRVEAQSQSARQTVSYLFASAGEGESTSDVVFSGHNMIYENGVLLAESAPFTTGYAITELDLSFILRERQRLNRSCETNETCTVVPFSLGVEKTRLTRCYWKKPFVPDDPAEAAARANEAFLIQAYGLKKRVSHTHAKKLIVGVSGGVDSTLALLVCRKALSLLSRPVTDILAVTMPCFGTSKRTRSNAEKLCDAIGVPCRTIDITVSVKQHLADLSHPLDLIDTAFENAQARERTQVLMDLANMEQGLVIGTGDLSELALGFATYNGDHMSMYGVNAGVPKTMIRCMLTNIAVQSGGPLAEVLLDIVDTPVSPELLPAVDGESQQVTEELVGPYELTDFFLYHMLRRGETREKVFRLAVYAFDGEYSDETIAFYLGSFIRRFFAQQFKRSCLPDGPRVGSVSLSPRGDWRMPSDASERAF